MTQILDSLPRNYNHLRGGAGGDRRASLQRDRQILCGYSNTTPGIQIARISDITHGYFERVVFPGECLRFEAGPDAHLEIHTSTMVSAILTDKIPCAHLQIAQASSGR